MAAKVVAWDIPNPPTTTAIRGRPVAL